MLLTPHSCATEDITVLYETLVAAIVERCAIFWWFIAQASWLTSLTRAEHFGTSNFISILLTNVASIKVSTAILRHGWFLRLVKFLTLWLFFL
jgi:hypothetical protein